MNVIITIAAVTVVLILLVILLSQNLGKNDQTPSRFPNTTYDWSGKGYVVSSADRTGETTQFDITDEMLSRAFGRGTR